LLLLLKAFQKLDRDKLACIVSRKPIGLAPATGSPGIALEGAILVNVLGLPVIPASNRFVIPGNRERGDGHSVNLVGNDG
jgi:hypothetical protein